MVRLQYIVVLEEEEEEEEEEYDDNNIRKFIKLIEQYEQA
jgi:hypothetical protein